jgi:TPR repeat protein
LYTKACVNGYPKGFLYVGLLLEEEKFVKVDLKSAIDLYRNLVSTDVHDVICRLLIRLMRASKDHEYDEECANLIQWI